MREETFTSTVGCDACSTGGSYSWSGLSSVLLAGQKRIDHDEVIEEGFMEEVAFEPSPGGVGRV